jgi:hypothetical protein
MTVALAMALTASAAVSAAVPVAITSREEIRDGKLYTVYLAPPCKEKAPACQPWQRSWNDSIQMLPGDVVTPDGLILRKTN